MNVKNIETVNPASYAQFLGHLKKNIQDAQLRAALSITEELTDLYWKIGQMLSEKISLEFWGSKTIEKIARDLKKSFPDASGFSHRNLKFMRQFAESYPEGIRETAVSLIPWGHNIMIMQKIENQNDKKWYAEQSLKNGWSRSMLSKWIDSNLHKRQGKAITNFKKTLPKSQSDLAIQVMKDPYNFDFVALSKDYREKELEQGLIDHIQKLLVELGQGFAFVGRQVKLNIEESEHILDLLFYHLKLRRYIVIEIKAREFNPRDVSQTNFYLSAVDDQLRHPEDRPSIGMIFCQTKKNITVEYALRDFNKPIGVAHYEVGLIEEIETELKRNLPTIEELEAELEDKKCSVQS
ncbi:PDDEXK nuclease domain-containing protein [Candidatus Neptunochlamydia vexilliferae]|uniref:DUF1016 domain-containing protein n=1 Tax=Candidatus Neptunichlamydia vexilliferae TaxID=1651774 RepID=A0ABS0AX84_9BACT|nr:PDDEXK nuclease domain-containing protein [Candidatus Neptunochlamydia vexilliferae]MBF5058736.1 hypothetical protein [Candidatus Neptunochlamydia vexilliferae]